MLEYKILKNITLLVADDNPMNRIVVRKTLVKYDVKVIEVVNGKEAIEKLNNKAIDIILMDIQMPIMDGIEATKLIRGEMNLEIPIIALTGSSSQDQIDHCLSIGMNAYVLKPFSSDKLLEALVNVIQDDLSNITLEDDIQTTNQNSDYDLSKLMEISNGDEIFVKKMIAIFITNISSSLASMKRALDEKNYTTLNRVAHRIKPSINDLGITQISSEIRQLEKRSIENPDSRILRELLIKIESVLRRVMNQLEKVID